MKLSRDFGSRPVP